MVAIRHSVSTSDQQRTTMILLCEDGSLRVFMASAEHTGYWMAPEFQPVRSVACLHTHKLKAETHDATNLCDTSPRQVAATNRLM